MAGIKSEKIVIPDDWTYESPEDIDKYLACLSGVDLKQCDLSCTPYDKNKNTWVGLDIIIKIPGQNPVKISKAWSPRYDDRIGGNNGKLERVPSSFGAWDYGFAYDGYIVNHRFFSMVGETMDEYNQTNKIHNLYISARSKTIPTRWQELVKEKKAEKREQNRNAQMALLRLMHAKGDINDAVYNKYAIHKK